MSTNHLHFEFNKKTNDMAFFKVSSCKVKELLFEGTIYSPNYDLVIYFISSDLLEKELCCTIKIDISVQISERASKPKHYNYHYKLSSSFSPEKYFTRISGLFVDIGPKISVDVYLKLKSDLVLKKDKSIPNSFPKQFNVIPLESIEDEKVYCENETYDAKSDVQKIFSDYRPNNYNYYISFNGTEEIIGPINANNLIKSSISQYYTHIFPISNKVQLHSNKLAFFVEIKKDKKEFFGIFPLSDIQKLFSKEYNNLSVNNQEFDSNIDYPSGVIIFGHHRSE